MLKILFTMFIGFYFIVFAASLAHAEESYAALDSSVRAYQLKVEDKKKKIEELAQHKAAMKDQAQIRDTLDEMVKEAKELKENFVKFQKEKKRLMYEFPSRGQDIEQRYKHFEVEIVDDLNSLSNIDLRLKGVLKKIEKAYEEPPSLKQAKSKEPGASGAKDRSDKPAQRTTLKEEPTPKPARPTLSY